MQPTGSILLVQEHFRGNDPRFLDELRACRGATSLKGFARRWYEDTRPFAREFLLRYVDDGCDNPHHRPLVKGLFKLAEAEGDSEVMAHFMVAFDRILRRRLVGRAAYNWRTRQPTTLYTLQNLPIAGGFSHKTRGYLRRRSWRYFRTLSPDDPAKYRRDLSAALALYRDEHFKKSEQLLDAWGLIHALYWGSPVLRRPPHNARLSSNRRLEELEFAPYRQEAWLDAFEDILALMLSARAGVVRSFAVWLLRTHYAETIRGVDAWRLAPLLTHASPEIQSLGVEMLQTAVGLETLSLDRWLTLLRTDNLEAALLLCERFAHHVTPERLSLEQRVALAREPMVPVARLGLDWAMQPPILGEDDLTTVLALAEAAAPEVRSSASAWLVQVLEEAHFARAEHLLELLDARYPEPRAAAMATLDTSDRFGDELRIWAALAESPYPEVRDFLIGRLPAWVDRFDARTLQHLWASSLLAIHRGSRAKRSTLRQVSDRVVAVPEEADALLPLMRIALRSVRDAERRAGLGAVCRAAFRNPALADAVGRHLPELDLSPDGAEA